MSLSAYLADNAMPSNPAETTTEQFLTELNTTTDPNHHLTTALAYCATTNTQPLTITNDLFLNSPIAGWILNTVTTYDKLTGSPLTKHSLITNTTTFCNELSNRSDIDPTITALNHHGLTQLFANDALNPYAAMDHAASYLTITDPHHWYAQDLPIAATILHYAIEVGSGPIEPIATHLMATWEQRLTHAVTSIDPEFAYAETQLLDIWQQRQNA